MDKIKEKVLNEYIKFRRLKNHTSAINDIEFHIKKFLTYSNKPLKSFDETTLLNYLDKISLKYSVQMLNKIKSSVLKNFVKWHFIDWSMRFRNLDAICKTEKAPETYGAKDMISEDEFKKMIKAEESHFWKAYFLTLFYGGCRPIEVCSLKWENAEFDNEGAYLTIYSRKNKRSFIKFVPADVSFYLKQLKRDNSEYVFCNSKTNKPISVKGAYWKIRKLSQKVLGHKIDLYTLRHSIATIIYNKDDIKDTDIAEQMGHSKSMKGKYVHNNTIKLKEMARKIYISPEELPPKQRHKLEIEVATLEKQVKYLDEKLNQSFQQTKKVLGWIESLQKKGIIKEGVLLD